jgi:flagellar basal body-associated protein FliL
MFFAMLIVIVVILAAIGVAAFIMTRHGQQEVPEPQPPEISYQ